MASFYGKNLRHNTGFWPRYKTCKTFPVDSETGALVRTCTNNNGACCSVQKPKFHGVRRPTHRLISTQVLLRVRQGRGFQPDGRDHPLEDALRHRLRRGPLPAPPLARGQGRRGGGLPPGNEDQDGGSGVKRAPACPYAHPASSAQPPKARARHGNKPPIRRLTPCYISPTHNLRLRLAVSRHTSVLRRGANQSAQGIERRKGAARRPKLSSALGLCRASATAAVFWLAAPTPATTCSCALCSARAARAFAPQGPLL